MTYIEPYILSFTCLNPQMKLSMAAQVVGDRKQQLWLRGWREDLAEVFWTCGRKDSGSQKQFGRPLQVYARLTKLFYLRGHPNNTWHSKRWGGDNVSHEIFLNTGPNEIWIKNSCLTGRKGFKWYFLPISFENSKIKLLKIEIWKWINFHRKGVGNVTY